MGTLGTRQLVSFIHSSGNKTVGGEQRLATMAGTATLSSTILLQSSLLSHSRSSRRAFDSSFAFNTKRSSVVPLVCSAKKKINFVDQILDYIEGMHTFGHTHFVIEFKFFFQRFHSVIFCSIGFFVQFQVVPS